MSFSWKGNVDNTFGRFSIRITGRISFVVDLRDTPRNNISVSRSTVTTTITTIYYHYYSHCRIKGLHSKTNMFSVFREIRSATKRY